MNSYNKTVKSKYPIYMLATVAISLIAALSGDVFQSLIAAGVCGGFFAALCLNKCKVWTIAPTMILPALITYLISFEWEKTLLALPFIPVGLVLYYCISKKMTRSQTAVRIMIALSAFYGCLFSAYIIVLFGNLSVQSVLKYVDLNMEVLKKYFEDFRNIYAQAGVDVEKLFPKEIIVEVIKHLKYAWLGYSLAFVACSSYLSTIIAKSFIPNKEEFTKAVGKWRFVLSRHGAVVFLLAMIINMVYTAETEGPYLPFAMNTISIAMYPATIYMGVFKVVDRLRSSRRMFFLITLIITVSIFGYLALLFLVITGVFEALFPKKKELPSKNQ